MTLLRTLFVLGLVGTSSLFFCGASWSQALVSTELIQGDPCAEGEFTVAVRVDGNTQGAIASYSLRICWNNAFTLVDVDDADFGADPAAGGANPCRNVSADNALSTLENGRLFAVTLSSPGLAASPNPISQLLGFGGNPLISVTLDDIEHEFSRVATGTPCGFYWGDLNANGIAGTLDASMMLRFDAILIDSFPCCDTIAPDFPVQGDVNGDGVLGSVDASLVLQFDTGLITCFADVDFNCDGVGPEALE